MKPWKSLWWWMKNVVHEGRLHILASVIPKEMVVVWFCVRSWLCLVSIYR